MDRPSWAPVMLAGALPRDLSDLLAIGILVIATIQIVLSQTLTLLIVNILWILFLFLLIPLTSVLAALSNSPKREREELALVAYGGSARQIELRYILRGALITAVGLLPFIIRSFTEPSAWGLALVGILALLGGSAYAIPALRRTRSLHFVEQYKG